jgi:hypothetical protein
LFIILNPIQLSDPRFFDWNVHSQASPIRIMRTLFATVALSCVVLANATDAKVWDAAAKLDAKYQIEDSSEWFRHKAENEWSPCSVTSCKDVSGEVEVFSSAASNPTQYLLRSSSAIDRGVQSRNRARLNDNANFGGEHWHCEADPDASDGCECKCSTDTNCKSIKHSDRFVKVCDGQTVEKQYRASKDHNALIASVDAGAAQNPGTDGVGNACAAGTYNIDGIGACSPHKECIAGEYLTGQSASAAGSCSPCAKPDNAVFANNNNPDGAHTLSGDSCKFNCDDNHKFEGGNCIPVTIPASTRPIKVKGGKGRHCAELYHKFRFTEYIDPKPNPTYDDYIDTCAAKAIGSFPGQQSAWLDRASNDYLYANPASYFYALSEDRWKKTGTYKHCWVCTSHEEDTSKADKRYSSYKV